MNNFSDSRRKLGESMLINLAIKGNKNRENALKIKAKHKILPDTLSLREIAILSNQDPDQFEKIICSTNLKIIDVECITNTGKHYTIKSTSKSFYKEYLQSKGIWPADGLLLNWWSDDQDNQHIKTTEPITSNAFKPKGNRYSLREKDFDKWRNETNISLESLMFEQIIEQVKIWSKNKHLWIATTETIRREFWQRYNAKHQIGLKSGRRAK